MMSIDLDDAALVVELVHRHLVVAVGVELPAILDAGFDDLGIGFADSRVQRDRRRRADLAQHFLQAPEAHPHPIFVPAPVRHVGKLRLALRRRDDHARHRARDVPFLERQHRPNDQSDSIGESQRRAFGDGRKSEPFAWLHRPSRTLVPPL
jgi:hypothetical protein